MLERLFLVQVPGWDLGLGAGTCRNPPGRLRRPVCGTVCSVLTEGRWRTGAAQTAVQLWLQVTSWPLRLLDAGSDHPCGWGWFLLGAPERLSPWLSRLLEPIAPGLRAGPPSSGQRLTTLQTFSLPSSYKGPVGTPSSLTMQGFHMDVQEAFCQPPDLLPHFPTPPNTAKTKSPTETTLMTKCCTRGGLLPTLAREPRGSSEGTKVHCVPKGSRTDAAGRSGTRSPCL